jgi:precorrin-2 dehydrogenase/sirohydrochlorin ferrochelatase
VGYPANLLVTDRRCAVVGAGRIAARKIESLLDAGADVTVVAPAVGETVRAWATEGRIQLVEAAVHRGRRGGAWLVITATDDPT